MIGDFGGFGKIVEEARALDADERNAPLVDCPLCGTPLDRNSAGTVNCPLGHFRSSGARRVDA